jgi:hypothetical protein
MGSNEWGKAGVIICCVVLFVPQYGIKSEFLIKKQFCSKTKVKRDVSLVIWFDPHHKKSTPS